jgi:hypothetical protein
VFFSKYYTGELTSKREVSEIYNLQGGKKINAQSLSENVKGMRNFREMREDESIILQLISKKHCV